MKYKHFSKIDLQLPLLQSSDATAAKTQEQTWNPQSTIHADHISFQINGTRWTFLELTSQLLLYLQAAAGCADSTSAGLNTDYRAQCDKVFMVRWRKKRILLQPNKILKNCKIEKVIWRGWRTSRIPSAYASLVLLFPTSVDSLFFWQIDEKQKIWKVRFEMALTAAALPSGGLAGQKESSEEMYSCSKHGQQWFKQEISPRSKCSLSRTQKGFYSNTVHE